MAKFGSSDELQGAEFIEVNLKGARFIECDLTDMVIRGVDINGTDIDAPWLGEAGASLKINGIEVAPYIQAELDRQFPGRADRRAEDPDGLRAAWAAVERIWDTALDRVAAMPAGTVDVSVDGEWSWAQTLRHLVHATDIWFGRAILEREEFHPLGLGHTTDPSADADPPSYADVLEARAGRVAMVRDYLATVTPADLDTPRKNPHGGARPGTTRSCLHVILEEQWEHYRFATRDLNTIAAR
jgi:hypothetical protein